MSEHTVINPGPAETPGSNDRRVGAPNTQQDGGTLMVGIKPDTVVIEAVYRRLCGEDTTRVLRATATGDTAYSPHALAVLVAEIVDEYTDHLVAERDALAEDLAWELHATRVTVPETASGKAVA